MKNNNGKIAIAIVAMFVVALSVVGFTYAYFTAQVVGNQSEEPSVTVEAGKLEVTYDFGRSIVADRIVPGWASDGDMIYDPVNSISVVNGENRITAKSSEELGDSVSANATEPVEPAIFSVTNTGTRDAKYSISLIDIINNIVDQENLRFTVEAALGKDVGLAEDEISYTDITNTVKNYVVFDAENTDNPKNGKVQLAAGTEAAKGTQDLFDTVTVATGKADYYRITLYYLEANTDQSDSANKADAVSLTVDVEGLGQ